VRGPGERAHSVIAYEALASSLREALAEGEFADGGRLPTEAELSETYSLSRQTVRRALQDLVAEGLIYRVRGRGTFPTGTMPGKRYLRSFGSVDDLLAYSVDTTMETIEPLQRAVDIDAASRLQLLSDEVMVGMLRRSHASAPFCVTRLAFSAEIGARIAKRGVLTEVGEVTPLTVISVVDEVAPYPIARANQSITAVEVPAELAELIESQPDAPVLRVDRLYYDTRNTPVELAVSFFNPARYTYRVELSRQLTASGAPPGNAEDRARGEQAGSDGVSAVPAWR